MPRETEYRLLTEVTRALNEAKALPETDIAARIKALDWNRRVWGYFGRDCSSDKNALPKELRASIVSLSLFVNKYTSKVMREHADISPLIDINIIIMQGLKPQPQAETAVEAVE